MKIWRIQKKDGKYPPIGGTTALTDATKEELCVLLCLFEAGDAGLSTGELVNATGCSAARVGGALAFWADGGFITECEGEARTPGVLLAPAAELGEAGASEIADRIKTASLAEFIDICQQTVGRVFNTKELATLTEMVEELPFSKEYLLILISYCVKKSRKFSFTYLHKMARSMLEEDRLTVEALNVYLEEREKFSTVEWHIRKLLGLGERQLTATERKYLLRWTGTYSYKTDIIGIAYDIAVNRTGKVALAYMDKLLTQFYEAGCKTVKEVEAYLEKSRAEFIGGQKPQHTGPLSRGKSPASGGKGGTASGGKGGTATGGKGGTATRGSSFSVDEYFAAALSRSYGDDGEEE